MDRNPNRDEYGRFIKKPEIDNRTCSKCGTHNTYIKNNKRPDWRFDSNNNLLCKSCYHELVVYPKWGKIHHDRYNKHRLNYPGQVIIYMWLERIGICNFCCAVVGVNCKKTDWHHYKGYVRIFPWYGIIELCASCHDLEKWRLGEFRNVPEAARRQMLEHPSPHDPITGRFIKSDTAMVSKK